MPHRPRHADDVAVRQRLARRPLPTGEAAQLPHLAGSVRADLGVRRPVTVIAGGAAAMPMTWGWRRPVVLVPAGAADWPRARRRAVLLHEMAHVARGDNLAVVLAAVACSLHWFNPLVWLAARRLRLESEHACDDRALGAGAAPCDYAADLLDIARTLRGPRAAAAVAQAMAARSQLERRLRMVLDGRLDRRGVSRRKALPAWFAAVAVVVPLAALAPGAGMAAPPGDVAPAGRAAAAPAPAALARSTAPLAPVPPAAPVTPPAPPTALPASPLPPVPPAPGAAAVAASQDSGRRISFHDDDGRMSYRESQSGHLLTVDSQGSSDLADDLGGIRRLAPGAQMEFRQIDGSGERALLVRGDATGQPVYTYRAEDRDRPFDAAGRAWLASMLLQLVRGSGLGAEVRAERLLRDGGPQAVMAEVTLIPGDHVKERYLKALLSHPGLPAAAVEDAVRQAGRELGSDHAMGDVLMAALDSGPATDSLALAVAQAARGIDGAHERWRPLAALVQGRPLPPDALDAVLQAGLGIHSDYELGSLLALAAARNGLDDPAAARDFLAGVAALGSDSERHRALSAAIRRGDLSPPLVLQVLRTLPAIESDFERSRLLIEIADRYQLDGDRRTASVAALRSIHSQPERERAEAALARR